MEEFNSSQASFLKSTLAKKTAMKHAIQIVLSLSLLTALHVRANEYPNNIDIPTLVQLALKNQFDIRIQEISAEQAAENIKSAGESFETTVSASASEFRDSNSNPNNFPYSVEGNSQSIAVQKRFGTGTSAQLRVNQNEFDGLAVPMSADATLSVSQQLLRGRSRAYNLAPIRIAQKRHDISLESLRQTVINTIAEAQFAYFDGILAEKNLEVAQESLRLAEQLLNENKRRAEIGSVARSDILQAEAEVAARRERVYLAEVGLIRSKNHLKALLSQETRAVIDWNFSFIAPSTPENREVELWSAFNQALLNRPDFRQATLNLEISEIEHLRQRHASLPALELFARMNMEGFGSSTGQTFNDLDSDKIPDFSFGVNLSRSLTNRAAKARAASAAMEQNLRQLTIQQLEQGILLNLDTAAAQIRSNWKRLETARSSRELAQKSLEAEQKRYQTGTSSTFILIRLQTDLVSASVREVVAENDYRKSLVEWDRQTAQILKLHNIEI